MILINNGDVFEIYGEEENLILLMEIDNDFFNDVVKREQSLFLCNSSINDNEHYDDIRSILAKVMYEYSNREYGYDYKIMSLLYDLIYLLNVHFVIADDYKMQSLDIKIANILIV